MSEQNANNTIFKLPDSKSELNSDENGKQIASIEEITNEFNKILDSCINEQCFLGIDCSKCREKECVNQIIVDDILAFIGKYQRIPYSAITSKVFSLDDVKFDKLVNNVSSIIEYLEKKESDKGDIKLMYKIRDHVNLASLQLSQIRKESIGFLENTKETFKKQVLDTAETVYQASTEIRNELAIAKGEMNQVTSEVKKETSKKIDDLNKELISIVSIFVAISFVMFGGMSLLNNLFDFGSMKKVPLLEMICGGSLIGIVMIVTIYTFVTFMLNVTGKINGNDKQPYKNVVFKTCIGLAFIMIITFVLWFLNFHNINDIKSIDSRCNIISEDTEQKLVTITCPTSEDSNQK